MVVVVARNLVQFRSAVGSLMSHQVTPADVIWQENERDGLFNDAVLSVGANETGMGPSEAPRVRVPREYLHLATGVACHRDPGRWHLLYSLLWRLHHGEPKLMEDPADPLMRKLHILRKQIGRDIHKTHAFVRFRKTLLPEGGEVYLAWHRPDHRILTLAAPFFVERFKAQRWGIATPDESCCWDGDKLTWGEGLPQSVLPPADAVEDLWRTYYRHIFNPARIKIKMMKSEMPVRHWATLPETQDIAAMLHEAPQRVQNMLDTAFSSSAKSQRRAARVLKHKD